MDGGIHPSREWPEAVFPEDWPHGSPVNGCPPAGDGGLPARPPDDTLDVLLAVPSGAAPPAETREERAWRELREDSGNDVILGLSKRAKELHRLGEKGLARQIEMRIKEKLQRARAQK